MACAADQTDLAMRWVLSMPSPFLSGLRGAASIAFHRVCVCVSVCVCVCVFVCVCVCLCVCVLPSSRPSLWCEGYFFDDPIVDPCRE